MTMTKFILTAIAALILTACSSETEKPGKAVMTADTMAKRFCGGDYGAQKELADACGADVKKFGAKLAKETPDSNCAELNNAIVKMNMMNAENPGSCMPKIRF